MSFYVSVDSLVGGAILGATTVAILPAGTNASVMAPVSGATVHVYERGTTTPVDCFADQHGQGAASPQPLTTDADGRVVDSSGAEMFTEQPAELDVVVTGSGISGTRTIPAGSLAGGDVDLSSYALLSDVDAETVRAETAEAALQTQISGLNTATTEILAARNHLVKVQWTPAITQTSADISFTADGQTTVTAHVAGSGTLAVVDGVACVDSSGDPIEWTAQVSVNGSGGPSLTDAVTFTPAFEKPSAANTGIPSGAFGDLRAPIVQANIAAADFETMVENGADSSTYTGYNIAPGVVPIRAQGCTFIGCTFAGEVVTNTGGTQKHAAFIDCSFSGGTDYAVQLTAHPMEFRRCDMRSGADVIDPIAFPAQADLILRHCWLHEIDFTVGDHSDILQYSTSGFDLPGWYGWFIGCFLEATESDGQNNLNSIIQSDGDETRIQTIHDHCWFDAPNAPLFPFHGPAPTRNQAGDFTFRNGFVGLHTGTEALFYPGFLTNATWENMVWETTGTTTSGTAVVAGAAVPTSA